MLKKCNLVFLLLCLHVTVNICSAEQKSIMRRGVFLLAALTNPALLAEAFDPVQCAISAFRARYTVTTHVDNPSNRSFLVGIAPMEHFASCARVYDLEKDTPTTRKIFEQCVKKSEQELRARHAQSCLPNVSWPSLDIPTADPYSNPYVIYPTSICTKFPPLEHCPAIEPFPGFDAGRYMFSSHWVLPKNSLEKDEA